MFHIIKYFRQNWVLIAVLVALIAITSLSNTTTIYAQADAEVLSDILNYPSDVEVGEVFTFFIRYRCASSTDDCGSISIDASFPDLIDIIDIQTGNADLDYTVSFDDLGSDVDGNDIILSLFTDLTPPNSILCDNSTDDVCFTAGQTGIATITARVHGEGYFQTGGPDIPINVDSTANDPMGGTTTTTTSDTTTISEPEARYDITKVRTDTPESAAEPIPGNNVTYQITITPTSQQDNLALSNITLTDTLPPNSVFVSASDGGAETAPGSGIVEWTGLSTSFDASDQIQPITVSVTVNYPLSDFSTDEDPQPGTATSVTNTVDYTGVAAQDPTGVCQGTCTGSTTNDHGFDPPTANPNVTKSIETNPVGIEGTGRFNLSIDNSFANIELTDAVLTDVLPTDAGAEFGLPLELEAIEVGDREATILVSTLSTCNETSPDTDFTTLTGSPFAAGSTLNATSHPADLAAGNAIKCIRWIWTDGTINAGDGIDGMQIRFTPRFTDADNDGNNDSGFSVPALGATYTNCMRFDFVGPDPLDPSLTPNLIDRNDNDCADVDIAGSDDNVSLASSKTGDGSVIPDDTIEFDINFNLTERSSQVLTNPVIIEALPLEFDVSTLVATINDPNDYLTDPEETAILASQTAPVVTNISGTNYNVIEWTLPDITPLEDENITFSIHIEVDLFPYIQNGIYTNYAYFLSQNDTGDLICETGILENDTEDLDSDGVTQERCSVSSDYNVPATAILEGQKWIQNETNTLPQVDVINTPQQVCEDGYTVSRTTVDGLDDLPPPTNLFSRYPCAADGIPGDSFTYSLAIRNTGNANIENYTLIDILPYPGDTEVIPRSGSIFLNRDSEWRPYLKPDGITLDDIDLSQDPLLASIPAGSQPTIAGTPIDDNTDVTIEYSLSSNPCRDEVATSAGCDPAPATWSFVPATPDDWKRVRAFKITANPGIVMRPADQIEITVEMEIPTDSPPDESGTPDDSLVPQSGEVIWNSYAHVGTNEVTGVDLLSAEPIKVGIRIPETVSVGNRVWEDINNSGDIDGTEAGIEGVTVTLYEWDGTSVGAVVDTTVTDAEGYYIFNLIPDGIDPNNIYSAMGIPTYDPDQDYVVVIDADNFDGNGTNDALQDYVNSDGNGAPNNEDDADDTFVAGVGYVSSVFQLDPDQEDTADETEVNGTLPTSNDTPPADDFGALGRGSLGQDDNNSDLRKDFGFWRPMSIGNRVWFDTGAGAGETNNGIQDASEASAGVSGVAMSLYLDDNADGIPDSTIAIANTTTDANGYYLFDQLSPGTYIVGVDITNFDTSGDPLFGYEDSDLNDTTDTDENDNGQTDTFQSIFGELSGPIVLEYNTEPTSSTTEVDQTVPAGYDQTGRDPDIPPDPDATRPEFGRYGALDENSNLTVDFGFWRPEFALGNFVWDDIDNDSQYDTGESPIENVIVNLYRDLNEDGTPDAGIIATTSTDATGYYFFDALAAGGYIVELDPDNWRAAGDDAGTPEIEGVLRGYISSTRNDSIDGPLGTNPPFTFPTEWDDQFDDGRNRDSYADLSGDGFVGTSYEVLGIRSETVTLVPESEAPGTENAGLPPNTDPDPTDGDTTEPHTDTNIGAAGRDFNSDLTVDFGVFIPLSLGNRIWQDNFEDPTVTKRAGDGIFDEASGETGIQGVTVWLYKLDDGGDPTDVNDYTRVQVALDVNATTLTDVVDTTDASGYYLFDGLGEGTYRVRIPRANFNGGVLTDFISSNGVDGVATTNSGDAADNQDSGIDATDRNPNVAGINGGIWSDQIVLTRDSEPTTGVDESNDINLPGGASYDGPLGIGLFNEDDDNSDLTVDFGFFRPLSLGNRVWFDPNGDGDIDGTEDGIDGVTVQLFQDDGTGTFIQVAEVETANGGYYRFDGLQPDDYQVRIPAAEFQAGGTLVQHISTDTVEPDPNSDVDSNDNGIDSDDPSVGGISSGTVTLSYDGEPTSDTDEPANYDDVSINPNTSTAGEGAPGADNNDQNLSVDFGFLKPFSLGNRVWYDYDADGIMDITGNDGDTDGFSGEVGVQGVTVNLYDAAAPTVIISTVFTDTEGYYRFDNLLPGDYIVEIPASEFLQANDDDDGDGNPDDAGELFRFASSIDAVNGVGLDPDTNGITASDVDDNGVDPATYGDVVRSQAITLGPDVLDPTTVIEPDGDDDEPTSYAAISIDPDNAIAVYDTRSNTTVDFGFFPYYSLGNRVWFDDNNDGVLQDTEEGVPGVTVNLYFDSNRDGTVDIDGAENTVLRTVTTSTAAGNEGFYRFDLLPVGNYIVEIASSNFATGTDPLFQFVSSFGFDEAGAPGADGDVNHDDDGRDVSDPVAPETDGVRSTQITIGLDSPTGIPEQDPASFEPTGELLEGGVGVDAQPGGYEAGAVDPDGITDAEDRRDNATVDFGFFRTMSLGNRVWLDFNGDGDIDAGEPGQDGVTVNLLDGTGNPILDNSGNPYTVVTDEGGYYRFDGLTEGDYIVEIPQAEFQTGGDLEGYISTEVTQDDPNETAPGTDSDDNGINVDDPSTSTTGVRSGVITLTYGGEPTGETDEPADYDTGIFPINNVEAPDASENLTIDFGFVRPFSLGNRVWLDFDADGVMDITGNDGDAGDGYSAEVGIPGVTVNLYNNISPTVVVSSVQTDTSGYYRFDNLMPGDYFVEIPAAEFDIADDGDGIGTSGELYQLASSQDALNGVGLDPDADSSDFDDNGVDPATYGDVVRSQVITLGPDTVTPGDEPVEPEDDDDEPGTATPADYGVGSIDPAAGTNPADNRTNTTVDFGFFPYGTLGNYVWLDVNNNNTIDGGEVGIGGVTVNLYYDRDGNGTVDLTATGAGQDGDVFSTVTTSQTGVNGATEDGYYRFDYLPAGEYIVEIPSTNFDGAADALFGFTSSNSVAEPDPDADPSDVDDNGIDPLTSSTLPEPRVDGVLSNQVTLNIGTDNFPFGTAYNEPTGETEPTDYGTDAVDPDGFTRPQDINENLTVDFGFFQPLSIGNRVWFDDDAAGDIDAGELGVDGVTVILFDSGGTEVDRVETGNDGYYRFDNLLPGDYYIEIPATEFQPGETLEGYLSSPQPAADPDTDPSDTDDNGISDPLTDDFATTGIRSEVVTLEAVSNEPTGETEPADGGDADLMPDYAAGSFTGAQASDNRANLTVDFGFFKPMSLGNRVWYDANADGDDLDGEDPIAGVTVELYRPGFGIDGVAGNADDANALYTVTTDTNGYYRFDSLPPGDYIVTIPGSNFDTGVLQNYISSAHFGTDPTETDPNTNGDQNDNGINQATTADRIANGVSSGTVTLDAVIHSSNGSEPTGEVEPASYGAGATAPPTGFNAEDGRGNLTVDFGFYVPLALGNRVFNDDGTNGGTANDGIQNGDEPGIDGVLLGLYTNNAGSPGTLLDTFITQDNGYYIFDGLPAGEYIVVVEADNFDGDGTNDALVDTFSSFFVPDGNDTDSGLDQNDNGIDNDLPSVNGIQSPPILLSRNDEPAASGTTSPNDDTDLPTAGPLATNGRNGELDENSDLTIDFGFQTPPMSIGNYVWYDLNNNGQVDTGENPVVPVGGQNIIVDLYRDNDANGLPDDLNGDSQITNADRIATTVLDGNGFYLFDRLTSGAYLTQGNYIVGLNFVNFRTGQILEDYYSSTTTEADPNTDGDQNDNGIDRLNANVGIFSSTITLSPEDEPTLETPLSGNATDHGPEFIGRDGQRDTNSNVTVDFGLYKPMSIGNRVWFDSNDNGLIDSATENGVAGVSVTLLDNIGTPISSTTTDANGYYLFDNLTPGTYQVRIDPVNWTDGTGPLDNLPSSTLNDQNNPTAPNTDDSNDNGVNAVDETDRETNGILSGLIVLDIDAQPTSEGDRSLNPLDGPNFIGNNGESDNNSDITIDFGFVPPNMSLGNFIWYDYNNNGLYDSATEDPVEAVDVSLFRADAGGNPTGIALQTDTTDANGYYLFDLVSPGQYVVVVNASNFAGGNPLENYISSLTGVASAEPNPDDTNDNGIDDPNPAANGIQSALIDLQRNNAPTGEVDLGPEGIGSADNDANSDLTIDFGFYQPMSLGNRVWFDVDDDGELDTTENGVGGVVVNLYDAGDLTTPISSTTTDTNGYYIFDGLIPGDYIVEIPTSEFGDGEPLENTVSSSVETPDTDDRDNGSNEPDPTTTPTRSGTITLELNNEPTGESEGPDGRGGNGETDVNSNLTVDFGFVPQNGYSLGNRVWIDADRDGLRVDTEDGVDGVALSLYLDVDVDGIPDSTTPIATTNTDADGYYIFDGLTAGTYIVGIDPSNFTGGPLVGYASTTPDVNIGGTPPDDDDNRASPPLGETFDATFGILSDSVTLSSGDEPTGEADLDPDGTNSAPDDNSDLTIDFGFYQGLALGNHVWFDSNNDGIQDAGEPGIGNVTVSLYTDDGTGNPDAFVDADTTDGNGYYLFNNLIPGDYIVVIDDTNFDTGGALFGYTSSPDADPTGDLNDNGIDDPDPLNNGGIISNVITLAYDSTPTGETDTSGDTDDGPNFRGINNETDNNSDLTVDFGFFTATMSIGNYVWLDDGAGGGIANNGVIDGGELGIEGVELELYPADTSGNINGSLLDTTTTDAEGYYLFDEVPPGNYVILVTPDNFGSGDPLENLFSSDGSDGGTDDKDDNGIDDINPETNGILSELITLQSDSAPTTEIADNISSDTVAYGPNGRGLSDPTDENSDLTIDFGFSATYDWGDAPDGTDFNSGTVTGNYGTVSGTGGANHRIISTLHLGEIVDDETGNLENDSATADDDDPASADDEDGVVIPPLVAGSIINIEVTVFNNTGEDAILIGWIDWNLDGDFDPEEAIPNQLPASDTSGRVVEFDSPIVIPSSATEQVVQIPVFVPLDSNAEDTDLSDGNDIYTFARFRLTTDTLDENDATGSASDGEVEDYRVQVQPPGLSIIKTDGANSVVVGQSTTYTITIRNSGVDVTNQNVFDEIPIDDPDGFDPDSIEWTCEANALASCIAGDALGTDIDTPQTTTTIDQDIDVLSGGEVVFTITATVRDNHVAATISNTATLESGPESTDEDGVIYDPPTGVKSGVRTGDTITWTMTWINTGGPQAATITDPIQSNQTFAGNLVCNEFGTSVTTTCSFSGGSITWAGTIGTGNPNRIEITFDVTTNGGGPYRNEATIDIGGDTATAAASVGSGDDDDDEDDPDVSGDDGGYINAAPSLTKSVDTPFTLPGATVVWTIEATNDTNATITTINITDPVPSELTITDVQSSSGDVAIDGQQITLTQGALAPGESITITITTDVGDNVAIPFAINNPASLTCDCTESRNAIATIVSVLELPATGETPWWRTIALLAGLSGIGVGGLLVYRRKQLQ